VDPIVWKPHLYVSGAAPLQHRTDLADVPDDLVPQAQSAVENARTTLSDVAAATVAVKP
jgi:hypothetical protein